MVGHLLEGRSNSVCQNDTTNLLQPGHRPFSAYISRLEKNHLVQYTV